MDGYTILPHSLSRWLLTEFLTLDLESFVTSLANTENKGTSFKGFSRGDCLMRDSFSCCLIMVQPWEPFALDEPFPPFRKIKYKEGRTVYDGPMRLLRKWEDRELSLRRVGKITRNRLESGHLKAGFTDPNSLHGFASFLPVLNPSLLSWPRLDLS